MPKASLGEEFKAQDRVPVSGIYQVIHNPAHARPHDVTFIEGRHFPACNDCRGEHPKFLLKSTAQHISRHPSFR